GADAARTVVAVPVGARETIELLEREADEVVCVEVPAFFGAVGFWYRDFGQVSDEEVVALLRAARRNGVRRSEAAIRLPEGELHADLAVPESPLGWVAFAHGSGSSRRSPRNVEVATDLNGAGIATMLFDLLTPAEELSRANVFDIDLLAQRLELGLEWLLRRPEYAGLPVGLFGASTGAAAALLAAARARDVVAAVVSRGGRPDLADEALALVRAPTLLIVGAADTGVLALNERAATQLTCEQQLAVVPGAAHLFEEPGALEQVAALARNWFLRHFERPAPEPRRGL
ncbi:MAG: dienelactone hydrolase family protein, partial [Gaiellales bacterium]